MELVAELCSRFSLSQPGGGGWSVGWSRTHGEEAGLTICLTHTLPTFWLTHAAGKSK